MLIRTIFQHKFIHMTITGSSYEKKIRTMLARYYDVQDANEMRSRMKVKTLMRICTFSLTYAQERREIC